MGTSIVYFYFDLICFILKKKKKKKKLVWCIFLYCSTLWAYQFWCMCIRLLKNDALHTLKGSLQPVYWLLTYFMNRKSAAYFSSAVWPRYLILCMSILIEKSLFWHDLLHTKQNKNTSLVPLSFTVCSELTIFGVWVHQLKVTSCVPKVGKIWGLCG